MLFWNDIDKKYFREVRDKELSAVKPANILEIEEVLKKEAKRFYHPLTEVKRSNFVPSFEVEKLSKIKNQSVHFLLT